MAHIKLPFQVVEVRHVQGKKDASKTYSIIGGVVVLPDSKQAYVELFTEGKHVYGPGHYTAELNLSVDQNKRFELRLVSISAPPVQKAA